MRRMVFLLILLVLLTSCAPKAAPVAPAETPVPTPTATPAPTAAPELTAEKQLHTLLQDYAPQTLNMFRPFEPIAISPQQFMDEMAAIRALPFEERTDWFAVCP